MSPEELAKIAENNRVQWNSTYVESVKEIQKDFEAAALVAANKGECKYWMNLKNYQITYDHLKKFRDELQGKGYNVWIDDASRWLCVSWEAQASKIAKELERDQNPGRWRRMWRWLWA